MLNVDVVWIDVEFNGTWRTHFHCWLADSKEIELLNTSEKKMWRLSPVAIVQLYFLHFRWVIGAMTPVGLIEVRGVLMDGQRHKTPSKWTQKEKKNCKNVKPKLKEGGGGRGASDSLFRIWTTHPAATASTRLTMDGNQMMNENGWCWLRG